ncbi:MAG TPA: hypothetical protein VGJ00_05935 [Rhabdochlamydiaceae bacterium]|jgi:hypothetical protein
MWIFLLSLLCCFSSVHAEQEVIEEGFVTLATPNYFGILETLVESVHIFSTRPVIAYGLGADIPLSVEKYPRLIKRRLYDVEEDAFAQKSRSMIESGLRQGIWVDADLIVNQGVDTLFTLCKKISRFPLVPIHPEDPDNQRNIMQFLNVDKKTMPYVHDCVILFTQECMPLLKEWHSYCLQYDEQAICKDETILNVLLWKYGVKDYLPICDPYFETYEQYVKNKPIGWGYQDIKEINYYMFHGRKDASRAREILRELIKYQEN